MSSTFSSTTIPTPSSTNQDTNNNSENNNSGKIIHRITLFKIPDPEHQRELLDAYRELERTAVKDSRPYILSLHAGICGPDPRSASHTVAVKSVFASKADMDYYDQQCEAHKKLKVVAARGKVKEGGVMTCWFGEEVVGGVKL